MILQIAELRKDVLTVARRTYIYVSVKTIYARTYPSSSNHRNIEFIMFKTSSADDTPNGRRNQTQMFVLLISRADNICAHKGNIANAPGFVTRG